MQILYNPHIEDTQNIHSTGNIHSTQPAPQTAQKGSFQSVLESKLQSQVNFSKHATLRLAARDINLSEEQIDRVTNGMTLANDKGIRSSLVLVDNIALLVNIPNKTVITAVGSGGNQNVFTNIDGAVIV